MKLKPVTRRFSKILAIWIVAVRAQGETTIHVPRSDFKLHENLEPQSAEAGRPPRAILVCSPYTSDASVLSNVELTGRCFLCLEKTMEVMMKRLDLCPTAPTAEQLDRCECMPVFYELRFCFCFETIYDFVCCTREHFIW